ncbi:MAG: hypothetical protein JWP01_3386 [Myxococcales bacterium]|nr:hypothetical protein [Myxococcales bacterium]
MVEHGASHGRSPPGKKLIMKIQTDSEATSERSGCACREQHTDEVEDPHAVDLERDSAVLLLGEPHRAILERFGRAEDVRAYAASMRSRIEEHDAYLEGLREQDLARASERDALYVAEVATAQRALDKATGMQMPRRPLATLPNSAERPLTDDERARPRGMRPLRPSLLRRNRHRF